MHERFEMFRIKLDSELWIGKGKQDIKQLGNGGIKIKRTIRIKQIKSGLSRRRSVIFIRSYFVSNLMFIKQSLSLST